MSDDEAEISLGSMFTHIELSNVPTVTQEPPRPPTPEPKLAVYTREKTVDPTAEEWKEIHVRLVGDHPLWGNYLYVGTNRSVYLKMMMNFRWNAARAFASYLDEYREIYKDRCILELGAGGALPSILAVKTGARKVVITDYPDDNLVRNIVHNVEANVPSAIHDRVSVQGYIWGRSIDSLLEPISRPGSNPGFDLIILSDLIFNHSQHDALLTTCDLALLPNSEEFKPSVFVFYSHHRPHLAHRDMEFFDKARERGWHCEEILTRKFPPMFPNDSGEESIRSTVYGWKLTRS
ncbi:hypothetical protein H0H87_006645 [Tephrocybe sp. NHM501043]|nr:hypothetical protein H0H87_006645 [Tephrocybe sp. NHM501043]